MSKVSVLYLPIGVGTFHMETASDQFARSAAMLREVLSGEEVICPEGGLLSTAALREFIADKTPDLIILENLTFANAAYTYEVLHAFDKTPILLWTLREPAGDGGRLKLNSLTGAFSAGGAIRAMRESDFEYVLGAPEEEQVRRAVYNAALAVRALKQMRSLRLLAVGHTPEGFGFGRALDQELMGTFGVRLLSVEARELIRTAQSYTEEEVREELEQTGRELRGLENMPEKNVQDFARLYRAYRDYVRENEIGALASRCWPDFFTEFGTPVCAVLSLLNSEKVVCSCEADVYGALSMYVGQEMTGSAAFFGDPVAVDENESTITFWHCGMAPTCLAREDTGACVGVHPNRKIGPTAEFGCKPAEKATIFRIGRKKDGSFRFFIAPGSILDRPRQYLGTSLVVQTRENAGQIVNRAVKDGWEPHYAVLYGDCEEALAMLGRMLGAEICEF
ncbi:MAG: fucose isomerase [Lachnospiraceae bacterium]|nr:fucose isomerase [Lachnospiraceae bacterium]